MQATEEIQSLIEVYDKALVQSPAWYEQLTNAINHLIVNDFNALVQILYRMDVSEKKLQQTLNNNPAIIAATLIADLMLQRQLEKLEVRSKMTQGKPTNEDESW